VKRRMVHLFAALIAVLAFAFAGSAFAGGATDVVKAKQTTLFDLLRQATPDGQKKIDAVFDEMLDYPTLAKNSLGPEWDKRSDAEKADFTDLLKKLVRNAYQKNLKKILDYDVSYNSEVPGDGGAVLVKTTSQDKGGSRGDPVQIDFKMVSTGGAWRVQDIVTEDVSLVSSYRSQFTKIINKDGFPKLIEKMKDKLAKGDTN
jgi:phospholipid transport system substrate-binding protein